MDERVEDSCATILKVGEVRPQSVLEAFLVEDHNRRTTDIVTIHLVIAVLETLKCNPNCSLRIHKGAYSS